jgi:hypothetical protein
MEWTTAEERYDLILDILKRSPIVWHVENRVSSVGAQLADHFTNNPGNA